MLGLAGIAEAALSVQLTISWMGLIVVLAGIVVAFLTHSRTWHIVAGILAASYGMVLAPWEAPFIQLTPDELDDPDIEMWLGRYRILAYACVAVALLTIANITQYLSRSSPTVPSEDTPVPHDPPQSPP